MNLRLTFQVLWLVLTLGHSLAKASDPVVAWDAAGEDRGSNWSVTNDKPRRADVTKENNVLRITDEESDGQAEDAYYHCELTKEQRAAARASGFVLEWTLRIPRETGGSTRAISTEVCIEGSDPASLLRFGLQCGRRGSELIAAIHCGSDGLLERSLQLGDADAFHAWVLVFDGSTQVVNVLVDGRLILKARIDHRDRGHHLVFGSRSTGEGTSEWKRVRFSLGTGDYRVVEPLRSESPRFWIMAKEKSSVPKHVDVFTAGVDGYFAYRIPSFIVAPNGDLLVFCEARKDNLSDDGNIDLVMKRSTDGGHTWLPHKLIFEEGGDARIKYGNPTAVIDADTSVIWLATNRDFLTERGARAGGSLVLFRSNDSGATWSPPVDISDSVRKPDWGHHAFGPGIGIQIRFGTHAGRLVLPANFRNSFNKQQPSYSHVIVSDDHGKTWKLGGTLGRYTNECQVAEISEDGRNGLLVNMRNHWGRGGFPLKSGKRLVARSFDAGQTWDTEMMDPALPEPPCQASLYRYSFATKDEPSRLLFANPIGPGRSNLRVRLSLDEGRTWPHGRLISVGSAAYSCMARLPNDRLGIIYERGNYQRISFSAITLDSLQ